MLHLRSIAEKVSKRMVFVKKGPTRPSGTLPKSVREIEQVTLSMPFGFGEGHSLQLFSSCANVAAAMPLLRTTHQGKTIAILLSDSGLKYLSTDLWL
jgi:hypothetical protein